MKRLIVFPDKCTGCRVCEGVCSGAFYKVDDREKSAIRIVDLDSGGYDIIVCDQCGDCMWMCSEMSLSKTSSGVVMLNKKTCVGCLICIAECKRDRFFYHDDLPTPFKCIACGLCAKQCSAGAISIEENNVAT